MIIHSFDGQSEPVIGPESFLGPQRHLCDICILTFSHVILDEMKRCFFLREVGAIRSVNGERPIYLFQHEEQTLAVFLTGTGATMAGTDVVELNWLVGATKFIMFGSAGSLNQAQTGGRYVLPTEAYRDEGFSYHYAPPLDYIRIKNAVRMAEMFQTLGLPYTMGRVWMTDAFYRETRNQVKARQDEGCVAVEMELAGVQAVCDFHDFELFDFLVTGDVLDAPEYQNAGLHAANHDLDKLQIALELAKRIEA